MIELPIEARLVPAALDEIRREGAQRRQIYPRLIEEQKLAPATAQRRLLALADAYRIVEAVSRVLAPLLADQDGDMFAPGAARTGQETTNNEEMQG
jgi:hypothetical protein